MLKVSLGQLKQTCDTRVIHYNNYARAALVWTKKKRSLSNEKLKARKEMLRIRRENKKTENHESQHLPTLKRWKRSDDNELESNLRLEKVVAMQTAQVGHGDRR